MKSTSIRRLALQVSVGLGLTLSFAAQAFAQASALPTRKPGLWEVSIRSEGESAQSVQKVQQCTSKEAEAIMLLSVVPGHQHCHELKVKRRGSAYDVRTVCYVHDNRVDAQVSFSGDLQSAYRGHFDVKYQKRVRFEPRRTVFEGRWLGACKPGQRIGDMLLPNGATVNVVDDSKRAEGHSHDGHAHEVPDVHKH